jgi:hypothetical protein
LSDVAFSDPLGTGNAALVLPAGAAGAVAGDQLLFVGQETNGQGVTGVVRTARFGSSGLVVPPSQSLLQSASPITPRKNAAVFVLGNELYLVGGTNSVGGAITTIEKAELR